MVSLLLLFVQVTSLCQRLCWLLRSQGSSKVCWCYGNWACTGVYGVLAPKQCMGEALCKHASYSTRAFPCSLCGKKSGNEARPRLARHLHPEPSTPPSRQVKNPPLKWPGLEILHFYSPPVYYNTIPLCPIFYLLRGDSNL